jgi:hypothetical protein
MLCTRIGRVISLLLLSTGCAREHARPPQQVTVPATNIPSAAPAAADTSELVAFRTAEGKVSRVGTELRIQLLDGRTAVFKDDTTPGLQFALPRYAGYFKPIRSHVLHILQYEGAGAYLVVDDSTGDSTIVFGKPVVSPDGHRFALTSELGDVFGASLIEVWRMVGRKPEKEFSLESEGLGGAPSNAVWRDSVTVDFLKNTGDSPEGPWTQTPAHLKLTGTRWVLSESTQ